jgi:hypothetical protein
VDGREDSDCNPHNFVQGSLLTGAMISIMTKDWTDFDKTIRVPEIVRQLGINQVSIEKVNFKQISIFSKLNKINLLSCKMLFQFVFVFK